MFITDNNERRTVVARADLLKKLFTSFKQNDKDIFLKIANEIIEDERKKNHGILADDLKRILYSNDYVVRKNINRFNNLSPSDKTTNIPLVDIIYPEKYFEDLVLDPDKIKRLERVIKEFANWEILCSNGVFPVRKLLFYGPPGCGKTLAAQAIAAEIGIPMIYVRFDAVVSSYLGETASNIRQVFEYAKNDSWVIFFDEFDSIGRSRNDTTEHGEIKRVVNAFLQQIDNYKGKSLIIAATNFEQSLDYAIWRRFDETICFDLPTIEEKINVFNIKLKRFKGPNHIISNYMSELEYFSHSDIERVCEQIIKNCILEGRTMYSKRDVEEAINQQAKNVALRKTNY